MRGLTLIEAIVSLALVVVVVGLVGQIMARSSRVTLFLESQDRRLVTARSALESLGRSAREAVRFVRPVPGSTAVEPELVIDRLDPDASFLPRPLPNPLPSNWSAHPNAMLVRQEVSLSGESLVLRDPRADGTQQEKVLGDGLTGLGLAFRPDGNLSVTLSYPDRQGLVTVSRVFDVDPPPEVQP